MDHRAVGFQCSSASRKFLNRNSCHPRRPTGGMFQCSSASRKFLNFDAFPSYSLRISSFSALQRAENSSMFRRVETHPKTDSVSVLFSEPKIPQAYCARRLRTSTSFSALQRAENSSIDVSSATRRRCGTFQCSSASRKFLNPTLAPASIHISDRDDHASSFLSLPGASP